MDTHGQRRPMRLGYSMVELLAVLMIIGVILSVSLPMFYQMGLFSGDKVEHSARELYAMLRAAKVYAAAKRTDCAVSYVQIEKTTDNEFNIPRYHLDYVFMVRKATPGEQAIVDAVAPNWAAMGYLSPALHDMPPSGVNWYVPLANRNGSPRRFDAETGVFVDPWHKQVYEDYSALPPGELFVASVSEANLFYNFDNDVQGFRSRTLRDVFGIRSDIYVADVFRSEATGQVVAAPVVLAQGGLQPNPRQPYCYYGHLFKQSGSLSVGSERQRFAYKVGVVPDLLYNQRFAVSDPVWPGDERGLVIELFQSTGRVKVATEELTIR